MPDRTPQLSQSRDAIGAKGAGPSRFSALPSDAVSIPATDAQGPRSPR